MTAWLHSFLSAEPISEYELIAQLKEQGFFAFLPPPPTPTHALFCAHFLLFHALYTVRDQLRLAQSAELHISPLAIQLHPYQSEVSALCKVDPLRDYYLDLDNLHSTGKAEVDELINAFWKKFAQSEQDAPARVLALAQLGLKAPVTDEQIRRRYKEQVMQHHPDRGGNEQQLQALNQAMAVLKTDF
ncbi:hypothetical protein MNBD_GAMMA18-719 [hydrothermal vent metagenome]|uniref:J domain-containing protein n=1 Tax=hydrothermal vent metagenome TaxID=652676 RepID=A0A3B0ZMH0_9ZZZZ